MRDSLARHRMRIEFTIPWRVAPKQSVRFGRRGAYQPKRLTQNAASLSSFAAPHCPPEPLEGPLRVSYVVTYAYLKRHTIEQRAAGPIPKDTVPDVDQLAKQLSDVLEASGFFSNDAQIVELHVRKMWDAVPSVRVRIEDGVRTTHDGLFYGVD